MLQLHTPVNERQQDAVDVAEAHDSNLDGLGNACEKIPSPFDLRQIVVQTCVGSQAVKGEALHPYLHKLLFVFLEELKGLKPTLSGNLGWLVSFLFNLMLLKELSAELWIPTLEGLARCLL